MDIYYHGTSESNAVSILQSGFSISYTEGSTFGSGVYLTDALEEAKGFGMVTLAVTVDSTTLDRVTLSENEIEYEEDWAQFFKNGVIANGYRGVIIDREDGFVEIVIYDTSCILSIKEVWRNPLLK